MKLERMRRDYGLTGQTILVRTKTLMPPGVLMDSSVVDPWRWGEQRAYVDKETPYFITVTILPHRAPISWGLSTPYKVALHKHDIAVGNVILKTQDGERIN